MTRATRFAIPGRYAYPILRMTDGMEVFGSPCADDYALRDMKAYYNRKGSGCRVVVVLWATEKPLTPMQTLIADPIEKNENPAGLMALIRRK